MSSFQTLLRICIYSGCVVFLACSHQPTQSPPNTGWQKSSPYFLSPLQPVSFEGRRAGEAYFDPTAKAMVFQSERQPKNPFFQIYLKAMSQNSRLPSVLLSPGHGKTTCAWLHPQLKTALFSSTHEDPRALEKQQQEYQKRSSGRTRSYSWDYDPYYDIYTTTLPKKLQQAITLPLTKATSFVAKQNKAKNYNFKYKNLTQSLGYDAEASYSPDGQHIVFASNRQAFNQKLWQQQGSKKQNFNIEKFLNPQLSSAEKQLFLKDPSSMMELYIMRHDGTQIKRLTHLEGYDGGPFFSPDGRRIVWRHFDLKGHQAEVFTMNIDGSDKKQITRLGKMSWAPYYHPSGDYIIFATNVHGYRNFELYVSDVAGQKTLRVTNLEGFDGLPVFTPSGDALYWTRRHPNGQSQIYKAVWDDLKVRRELGLRPYFQTVSAVQPAQRIKNEKLWLKNTVHYFAQPKFKGRLTGSPEEKLYTQQIADYFKALGLKKYKNQYIQKFRVPMQAFRMRINRSPVVSQNKNSSPNQASNNNTTAKAGAFVWGRNVLGFLPVKGASKTLILGAHADHLGSQKGPNSLATNKDKNFIHHGADDNASGMAVLLSLARFYALNPQALHHNLLFALWSGEEQGTLGSSYFIKQHKKNKNILAYLNLDMLGHLGSKPLIVQGVGSSATWPATIENLRPQIALSLQSDPYVSTDAMPFYLKKLPVLSFFTGAHKFYHTPRDKADTLDYEGLYKVQQLLVRLVHNLQYERPLYRKVKAPEVDMQKQRQGLKLYLGTVPDYASQAKGLKLAGVVAGGPAEKAGLREGDVITKLQNFTIKNIYDYARALRQLEAKTLSVSIVRKGQARHVSITPTLRQ